MSLSELLKQTRKLAPSAYEDDNEAVTGLSTGSLAVDWITGIGGFPKGRLTEVAGWEASGKTTLCLQAYAAAQRAGLYPVYLDPENGVDRVYAERIGCNFSDERKGLYLNPDSLEENFKLVELFANSGDVHLCIVDSVSALVPKDALEGDILEGEALGARARLFSQTLPKITKLIKNTGMALVFVNQLRENIETGWAARYAPKYKSTGGRALPFYAWLRLNMKQVKKGETTRKIMSLLHGKEVEIPISSEHSCDLVKSKVCVAHQQVPVFIRFDDNVGVYGIDNLRTLLNMGIGSGVISKKGSYYSVKGNMEAASIQGEENMYQFLHQNPDVVAQIAKDVGVNWDLYA